MMTTTKSMMMSMKRNIYSIRRVIKDEYQMKEEMIMRSIISKEDNNSQCIERREQNNMSNMMNI